MSPSPPTRRYRLLNVFGIEGEAFSGNPLCVFEDAAGLTPARMLAWARQFNLSETSFVVALEPGGGATSADVRIFTPSYEMPFAGHPTLGTAQVVADLLAHGDGRAVDEVVLSVPAGDILVRRTPNGWQLRAAAGKARPADIPAERIANALGVAAAGVLDARWVDAGVEQLIVELAEPEVVRACSPVATLMSQDLSGPREAPHVYAWAMTGERSIEARLFAVSGTALDEDPATGSACANLGTWLAQSGRLGSGPVDVVVSQGAAVDRPSRLDLHLDGSGGVFVGGRVEQIGEGSVRDVG